MIEDPKVPGENPLEVSPPASSPVSAEPSITEPASTAPVAQPVTSRALSEAADAAILAQSRRQTRRSFLVAGAAAAAGVGFYEWLDRGKRVENQPTLLRHAFDANAAVSRALFRDRALAPTYPLSAAGNLRVNGVFGLKRALEPESWRLQVTGTRDTAHHPRYTSDVTAWEYRYVTPSADEDPGHDNKLDPKTRAKISSSAKMAPLAMKDQLQRQETQPVRPSRGNGDAGESHNTLPPGSPGLLLQMSDLLQLPRHELVTQFKCIEGWSQVVHWAGVRCADFLEAYPPEQIQGRDPRFVYMETPDGDFYNSYHLDTLRHPQALLVTEMMGAPLTQYHGAPLRLHLPNKYGYKQIKRIGLISYMDTRPDDFWTELGWDWYAGL